MARFKLWVQTDRLGSKVETEFEIDDEDLADYERGADREEFIELCARDERDQMIQWEWGWEPIHTDA
jgi:hypothetical protein